ncbi:MAG: hydrogenase expression/formation protein HypE, partial [Spirochaetaceae bacterium]
MNKNENVLIRLAHGNGGRLTNRLVNDIFIRHFKNPFIEKAMDAAVFLTGQSRLVFTTDTYVIRPLFFPGGNIGKLSICGTANDCTVMGARPLYVSCGFVIEEGFPVLELEKVVISMKEAASEAGVIIVTGDTKVVEKGKADNLFINTSGIGEIETKKINTGNQRINPGDVIIVSGTLGDHAAAVISARKEFPLKLVVESDAAPLWDMIAPILEAVPESIKIMRDPTRGGLATTLNEFVKGTSCSCTIDEKCLPVRDDVKALCELAGFDPIYLANEGKIVIVCDPDAQNIVLQ